MDNLEQPPLPQRTAAEPVVSNIEKKRGSIGRFQLWFYVVMALSLGGVIGFFVFWYTMGPTNQSEAAQGDSARVSPTPSATPTVPPQIATDPASSDNIVVVAPLRGNQVKSPINVMGKARVFESALSVRLKDATGLVVTEQNITTVPGEVGQFSDFSTSFHYPKQTPNTRGTLEVFSKSAQDGSEEDLIQIPVVFQ